MKLGILKSWEKLHLLYVKACEDLNVEYEIIDILDINWISLIKESKCNGFLCQPPCDLQERKSIFDEKIFFIVNFLKKIVYPSYNELFLYENKRNVSYFLEITQLPHPPTYVISRKEDAYEFIEKNSNYPIVLKSNIGAGSSGVTIIKTKREAISHINKVFGRIHKFFAIGKIHKIKYKNFNFPNIGGSQKHYLIVQEFLKLEYEWRIIKIGDYFAGYKRPLKGYFASGSGLMEWGEPPISLLNLVNEISNEHNFYSLSIDFFKTYNDEYLINEIQPLFGSYSLHQMKINDKKGIFHLNNGKFEFIEGEYHQNGSNNLRVNHFLKILQESKNN